MTSKFLISAAASTPLLYSYLQTSAKFQDSVCDEGADEIRRAICVLDPQPNQTARGVVRFEQTHFYSKCKIDGKFTGLSPGMHGFHVH